MKTAQTYDGKPIIATATSPRQAVCPECGGLLTLRRRRTMDNGGITYFWRHRSNINRYCAARHRPIDQ